MKLKRHCIYNLWCKKRMLLKPSNRMFNCHHTTYNKRMKDNVLLMKFQSVLEMVHAIVPTPLPTLASTRQRTLKHIQFDEGLVSSLEGTLSKCAIAYQTQQIVNKYFYSKCDGDKCRLFLSLLKSRCMTVVKRKLGINMINNSGPSSHIVKILVDAFSTIGKKTR